MTKSFGRRGRSSWYFDILRCQQIRLSEMLSSTGTWGLSGCQMSLCTNGYCRTFQGRLRDSFATSSETSVFWSRQQIDVNSFRSIHNQEGILWKMTHGEIRVFLASLHVISSELSSVKAEIPNQVYSELSAMEKLLKKAYDENSDVNLFPRRWTHVHSRVWHVRPMTSSCCSLVRSMNLTA